MPRAMILAGDIGGTKTILAALERGALTTCAILETYPSQTHATFAEILELFLQKHRPRIELACVGVAGPVKQNRCEATNLPWVVDGAELAAQLDIAHAWLLNDLEAFAYGTLVLRPEDTCELSRGASGAQGNRAVIAAGTGLGEAALYWDGKAHHPFATEGGHADFGPRDELEMDLLRFLLKEHSRISWERVVSGMGLANIYRFFRDTGREEEPAWLAEEMKAGDPGRVISRHAQDTRSRLCARTLDLFVSLYGAEAGNLALKTMASGGLYVGGGIAPKNLDRMKEGSFMKAFLDKGRMRPLLQAMPVRIILNDQTGLIGAAHCAALRAGLS
jgi:glucokinase